MSLDMNLKLKLTLNYTLLRAGRNRIETASGWKLSDVAHLRQAFEVNVLGPERGAREPSGGQDDAVGHCQVAVVCEPCRLQR